MRAPVSWHNDEEKAKVGQEKKALNPCVKDGGTTFTFTVHDERSYERSCCFL